MIKPYTAFILASSFLLLSTMPHVYADENLPASNTRIQRSFVNLSFEQFTTAPPDPVEKGWNGSPWAIYNQKQVIGWRTTAKTTTYNNTPYRGIEIWNDTRSGGPISKAQDGVYYAELNAHFRSTLYQNICLQTDDTFDWSLQHRGRNNSNETMQFVIADKIEDRFLSGSTAEEIPVNNAKKISEVLTAVLNQWTEHKSVVPVKAADYISAAKVVAFGLQATNGSNEGNFLDNIKIKLRPAIEFSANNNTVIENQTSGYHAVEFNIVGFVDADFDVAFTIDNTASINPAIYDTDYKIFNKNSGTAVEIVPVLSADSKKLSFKYKVKYNPSLNYATGVKITDLVIQVINNNNKEGNKTIPFILDKTQTTIAVMALSECGGNVPNGFNYTIEDDDVDLSITKKINETIPLPGSLSSYEMVLFNDSKALAKNVKLIDVLGANLAATVNTELTCKMTDQNGIEVEQTCEALLSGLSTGNTKTWASQLLSTSGLALGNVPANQYFKFTLKNLIVSTTDKETTQANKNYIINNIEVKTDSTDQNLANNIAIAKTMYAAQSDLSNNILVTADNATGTGMFIIGKEGRTGTTPLWTQKTEGSKAYFPLKIQNSAALVQDYQLYASSSKVEPTLTNGDYSTLVRNTITPFTSGLKVEFYKVEAGQCKVGLTGQQITQLNIAANTVGQVCAVVTASASITSTTNIWFAIESLQSGLGDIILDAVIAPPKLRSLELSNDQTAQVAVGGTYVFLHRLTNTGVDDEKLSQLNLVRPNDGFLYTLFLDKNKNDALDAGDTLLVTGTESELTNFILQPNQSMSVLIKVEAPSTATHGMSSQVKLVATANNDNKATVLSALSNTDSIIVSPNQLQILKSQFKVENCDENSSGMVLGAAYSLKNENLRPNQCLIYRIAVKNMGNSALNDVTINDMYPAYTEKWTWGGKLPIIGSQNQNITADLGHKIEDSGTTKIKALLKELLPQQEKSLYFGIRVK